MCSENNRVIIYHTVDGRSEIKLYAQDGRIWLTQQQLSELFATSKQSISYHVLNILKDKELSKSSVVKESLTTAQDGKSYQIAYYALEMILAIGFRVKSIRGTQFRQWATRHLSSYLVKGFIIDDDRLKNPDGRPDYFDELLARIRDIRASEKRFYQKIRDLLALSSDYIPSDKATQMFFAETQNKLLYAVTGKTAAELVMSRADALLPNMGLTSWSGGIVRKGDVVIAKNYLSQDEIDLLNRLVVVFLETAEIRVRERLDLTVGYWRQTVNRVIEFQDKALLTHTGKVSNKEMEGAVRDIYAVFDKRRKMHEADQEDEKELMQLEEKLIRKTAHPL